MRNKILVVDDEEDFLNLMLLHLKKRGFEAIGAPDGIVALEIFKREGDFAVIVTDWMMPNMSGNELVREAQNIDPNIQAVVITSASHLRPLAGIPGWGNFPHLVKPLERMSVLSEAVQKALDYRNKLES